jgi:hypothetical protein
MHTTRDQPSTPSMTMRHTKKKGQEGGALRIIYVDIANDDNINISI